MSNSSMAAVASAIGSASDVVIPDVPVPDVGGQANYPTDLDLPFDPDTGEGLSDSERVIYLAWLAAGSAISDGAFPAIVSAFVKGLKFFWDNILLDSLKAHGKRDYLYSTVAEAVLYGDATYRQAKADMLKANTPAWKAFPTVGTMGVCEITDLTYWSLLITWNSVRSTLRLPNLRDGFNFDQFWHDTLKNKGFFSMLMHEEKDVLRLWIGSADGAPFEIRWWAATDDPDEEEIDHFASSLAAFVNTERTNRLRRAAKTMVDHIVSLKEEDEKTFLPVILLNDDFWQKNWRWCKKCRGLFFAGHNDGVCPVDKGHHDKSSSGNYSMNYNEPKAPDQHNWRWCQKCQGLYYAGREHNHCPAGDLHDGSRSGDYIMHEHIDAWSVQHQSNWRWCKKCQGLYHVHDTDNGHCPAGGAHDGSGSGHYILRTVSDEEPPIVT